MDRCMGDGVMNTEYPDGKQRYAVCMSQWEKDKKLGFAQAEKAGLNPFEFYKIGPAAAAIVDKTTASYESLVFRYIMDKIPTAEFDKGIADLVSDLEPVGLEMQAWYDDNN